MKQQSQSDRAIRDAKNKKMDMQSFMQVQERVWRPVPHKIRNVFKLCFSSLVVLFTEVDIKATKVSRKKKMTKSSSSLYEDQNNNNSTTENESFVFVRMKFIPIDVVCLFWKELLGLINTTNDGSSPKQQHRKIDFSFFFQQDKEKEYWKYFISERERNELLRIVEQSRKDGDVIEYLKDQFVNIGLIRIVSAAPAKNVHKDQTSLMRGDSESSIPNPDGSGAGSPNGSRKSLDNSVTSFNNDTPVEDLPEDANNLGGSTSNAADNIADWPDEMTVSSCFTDTEETLMYEKRNLAKIRRNFLNTFVSECFQIGSVAAYEYGLALSRTSVRNGGFLLVGERDDPRKKNGKRSGSSTTVGIWNELMVNACLKLRKPSDPSSNGLPHAFDFQPYSESSKSFANVPNGSARSLENASHFTTTQASQLTTNTNGYDIDDDATTYVWIPKKPNEKEMQSLLNESVMYTLRMLPSHLMRANRISEAIGYLCSESFVFARLILLGVTEGVHLHRHDCLELLLLNDFGRVSAENHHAGNDRAAICKAFQTLKQCFFAEYPILPGGEDVVGETYRGEIGKALHSLATTLEKNIGGQMCTKEALQLYIDALLYKKASLGDYDISIAHTFKQIGNIYLSKEMFSEGLLLYGDALQIEKEIYGPKHIRVAQTMNNMALGYSMTGEYELATSFYEDILSIECKTYGESSMQACETTKCLGRLNLIMKRYDLASQYLHSSLSICKSHKGEGNIEVADLYHQLGILSNEIKNYPDGLANFKKSYELKQFILGDDHPSIARTLHHLGLTFTEVGDLNSAITCYEKVLRIRKMKLGHDHEEIARTLFDLAQTMQAAGEFDLALEALEETLRIIKLKKGSHSKNDEVCDVLHRIAGVYSKKGSYINALDFFNQALHIRIMLYGKNHISVASNFYEMGNVYCLNKSYDKALDCYAETLSIRQFTQGKQHTDVAEVLNSMGSTLIEKGDDESINQAKEYFKDSIRIFKLRLGYIHEKVAETLDKKGMAHKCSSEYDLALECYLEALEIRKTKLGRLHIQVADTMYNIGVIQAEKKLNKESLNTFQDVYSIYKENQVDENDSKMVSLCHWISFLNNGEPLAKAA